MGSKNGGSICKIKPSNIISSKLEKSMKRPYFNAAFQTAKVLIQDVRRIEEKMRTSCEDQYLRRTYYRTEFAFIEAGLFGLMYAAHKGDASNLKEKKAFLDNVYDTFTELAATLETEIRIDKQSREWDGLAKAIKVRDRITHPKKVADLDISEKELEYLHRAALFFTDTTEALLTNAGL
jgi:hypothetical protein